MNLWCEWWRYFEQLRPAFNRSRTFLWFAVCVIGITVRQDCAGVTSIIRALGLKDGCYERLLGCFHSKGINLDFLCELWARLLIQWCSIWLLRINGRVVLIGDGIKVGKSGKKMPGVKRLHQESESNTKPEYILGHSCQAIGLVFGKLKTLFLIPIICRIHEGIVFSNRDKRSLVTKMMAMLQSLHIKECCYFVADAYYANQVAILALLKKGKDHLITRVRTNAVAYLLPEITDQKKKGRKRKYGQKLYLRSLFDSSELKSAPSPINGEDGITIQFLVKDLLWKSIGILVRFVIVVHPIRGRMILLSTDLSLDAPQIILLYSVRFKIEVSFKQAIHTLGTYAYHFWMKTMTPRNKSAKNQHVHLKSTEYRDAIRRKLHAYHTHIMAGIVAQGLAQILAVTCTDSIWTSFGSWLRTVRPGILPSEQVVCSALYYSLSQFLKDSSSNPIIVKFILQNLDLDRDETKRLIA